MCCKKVNFTGGGNSLAQKQEKENQNYCI